VVADALLVLVLCIPVPEGQELDLWCLKGELEICVHLRLLHVRLLMQKSPF
jgi:hypothetical protein